MNFSRRISLALFTYVWLSAFLGSPAYSAKEMDPESPRWRFFTEKKDNFDIVFIGSSRIYHGISPRLFDHLADADGHHWRSFNLGVDKMRSPGCLALAHEVAALRPRNLKYLFFELQSRPGGHASPQDDEVGSTTNVSNLNLAFTRVAFGGRAGLGPDGDGFNPLNKDMSAQMRPKYEARLRAARQKSQTRAADPTMRSELTNLADELAAQKIQLVFVVAPSLRSARGSGVDAPPGHLLFSFDDLQEYAPLYAEENRPDAEHLNARGAALFTRDLAEQFMRALASSH